MTGAGKRRAPDLHQLHRAHILTRSHHLAPSPSLGPSTFPFASSAGRSATMHEQHLERVSSVVEHTIADERVEGLQLERIRSPERTSHPPCPSSGSVSFVNDIEQEAALPRCEHEVQTLGGTDRSSTSTPGVELDKKDGWIDEKDRAAEESTDPNLVSWDSPESLENPRNWTFGRRYIVAMTVAMYTFLSPIASSAIAPALPNIAHDLNVTGSTEINLLLSLFVLAFAFGAC